MSVCEGEGPGLNLRLLVRLAPLSENWGRTRLNLYSTSIGRGGLQFGPAVSNLQKFSSGGLPLPQPQAFQVRLGNSHPHWGSRALEPVAVTKRSSGACAGLSNEAARLVRR